MTNNLKLLDLLKREDLLSPENISQIEEAINKDKNFNLSSFVKKEKIINSEKLTELKSELYNIPYKNLVGLDVEKDSLNLINKELSENYLAVCFDAVDNKMLVGLVDPNLKTMEAISFLAKQKKLETEYYLISKSSFNSVFKGYKKMEEEVFSAIETKIKEEEEDPLQIKKEFEQDILDVEDANSAPVAKIVSVIIRNAIDARASDIHIEPYEKESRVRYRVDGILKNALFLPRNIHSSVVARVKVLAKMKMDETRIPQDGRIVLVLDGREIDFRISTLPIGGDKEKVVLRILDTAKGVVSLEKLGFNNYILEIFKRAVRKTNGIILSTGPTGSGKTTTLYSVISILNQEGVNISTLEDPIEYQIKGVNQSQIRPKIGYSFATGLRSLVRQDPDVIMVGEIRDDETAELSVHAGLTGHLVLSTLHTNDAIGSVFRLIDMKVEPVLLASILRVIVAQRLARRLCEHCKKEVEPEYKAKFISEAKSALAELKEEVVLKEIKGIKSFNDIDSLKIYKPVGCSRCQNTGYLERVAIGEAIEIDENVKKIIITDLNSLSVAGIRKSQDFISLKQDGFLKVLNGFTNFEEILRVIES
ncbi:MAG: ATPase, T2SS/T4P/T4SS family [Patescibacteria group bacterium]|jgi:type IV pilus assembly protein PilB